MPANRFRNLIALWPWRRPGTGRCHHCPCPGRADGVSRSTTYRPPRPLPSTFRPDDTRILGGEPAEHGAWPWQVALISVGEDLFEGQFCGGSIIAGTWVLTAAHCVYEETPDHSLSQTRPADIQVLAGTNVLENDGGELIDVTAIYAQPDYDPTLIDNDLALIHLAHAPTEPDVAIVRLPSLSAEAALRRPAVRAIVTGWGRLQNGRFPVDLMQVQIQTLAREDCNQSAVGDAPPKPGVVVTGPITDNMICAGSRPARVPATATAAGRSSSCFLIGPICRSGSSVGATTADNAAGCASRRPSRPIRASPGIRTGS